LMIRLLRALAILACMASASVQAQAARELQLAYVGDPAHPAWKGIQQAHAEANLQGRFLGQQYQIETLTLSDLGDRTGAQFHAVIAAIEAEDLIRVAESLPNVPILNVAAEQDWLRQRCAHNLFHVLPSARMRADAIKQWQTQAGRGDVEARAWHSSFKRYAAAQLNRRYQSAQGEPMQDLSWAGWAGVKLVTDLLALYPQASPTELMQHLHNDLAFDGQKGQVLTFRPTGQLRQPLLLIAGDSIVGEAPLRGVVDITDLDSLGTKECPK